MKTPYAILIGLSLIAAAIFFKDTVVNPAHAIGGPDGFAGFSCAPLGRGSLCYVVDRHLNLYVWQDGRWKKDR